MRAPRLSGKSFVGEVSGRNFNRGRWVHRTDTPDSPKNSAPSDIRRKSAKGTSSETICCLVLLSAPRLADLILSLPPSGFRNCDSPQLASGHRQNRSKYKFATDRHKAQAAYSAESDFVFTGASGKPPWPDSLLADHLKPAAAKAGIGKIGWHTFRRSYATLLHGSPPGQLLRSSGDVLEHFQGLLGIVVLGIHL